MGNEKTKDNKAVENEKPLTFLERFELAETEEKKIQKFLERGLPFKSIDYDYYMRAVR